jgi:hypothetical protein
MTFLCFTIRTHWTGLSGIMVRGDCQSFLIGNHERDLKAANRTGILGYLFSEDKLYDVVLEVPKKQEIRGIATTQLAEKK